MGMSRVFVQERRSQVLKRKNRKTESKKSQWGPNACCDPKHTVCVMKTDLSDGHAGSEDILLQELTRIGLSHRCNRLQHGLWLDFQQFA